MVTKEERQSLADGLIGNPLWAVLMAEQEANAVERLIHAQTDIARLECQLRVQAVRAFRADCEASLRSTRPVKGAPA